LSFKAGDKVRCKPTPNRDDTNVGLVTEVDHRAEKPYRVEFNDGRWYTPVVVWFAEHELIPAQRS
jgi:hypothetical protein